MKTLINKQSPQVKIIEDYCDFEIAKLLENKGFNEKCFALYNPNGILIQSGIRLNNVQVGGVKGSYSAPTLQMAMKWLRENHGLFIHIDVIREASCWLADIQDIKGDVSVYPVENEFPTYEEACEAGIKYCLEKLI